MPRGRAALGLAQADPPGELISVHVRHVDVGEDERVGALAEPLQPLDAVVGGLGTEPDRLELGARSRAGSPGGPRPGA